MNVVNIIGSFILVLGELLVVVIELSNMTIIRVNRG